MSNDTSYSKRATSTTVGWILWRGGMYFCGAYIGYEGTVRTWRFLLGLDLPSQVFAGIIIILIGSVLVVASLILERIADSKLEKGLHDE